VKGSSPCSRHALARQAGKDSVVLWRNLDGIAGLSTTDIAKIKIVGHNLSLLACEWGLL
jgi:hypothetical protein